jgi:hypothetical protein
MNPQIDARSRETHRLPRRQRIPTESALKKSQKPKRQLGVTITRIISTVQTVCNWLFAHRMHRCYFCFHNCTAFDLGRDSTVGIATRYRLDGQGTESRRRRDFPRLSRPGLPSPLYNGTGSFPGVKRPRPAVDQSPYLAPRLKKEQSYTSTPLSGHSWPLLGEILPLPLPLPFIPPQLNHGQMLQRCYVICRCEGRRVPRVLISVLVIVTSLRTGRTGGDSFISKTHRRPFPPGGPPSLYLNVYRDSFLGIKRPERDTDHSCGYTSTPHLCLHDMYGTALPLPLQLCLNANT